MSGAVLAIMLCSSWLLGALVGIRWGAESYRRRLWRAARAVPGDQVALATLERAMSDDRRVDL